MLRTTKRAITVIILCAPLLLCAEESERLNAVSVFGGQMTDSSMDDFVDSIDRLNFENSYLLGVALSRTIKQYGDLASLEIEGQIVRHFDMQTHWEFNAQIAARWEKFYWDNVIDTSLAIGIGPSYATSRPETEEIDGDKTAHFLTYMMVELELTLPDHPNTSLITRIHHRSCAFGVIADNGSSNALTVGLKHRF